MVTIFILSAHCHFVALHMGWLRCTMIIIIIKIIHTLISPIPSLNDMRSRFISYYFPFTYLHCRTDNWMKYEIWSWLLFICISFFSFRIFFFLSFRRNIWMPLPMSYARKHYSDVDEYGFKRDRNFDYTTYENIMTNYYTTLTKRRIKWQSLMKNPPRLYNNKSSKLKRYIRKGIPGEFFFFFFSIHSVLLFSMCVASHALHAIRRPTTTTTTTTPKKTNTLI